MGRVRKKYSREFKLEAVRAMRACGSACGLPIAHRSRFALGFVLNQLARRAEG